MVTADVLTADARHVWHPYAPHPAATEPFVVHGAEGTLLDLEVDGQRRRVIDGMSSWWSVIHGHGHPALREAAHRQIDAMSHVMFGGLTHHPAVNLATALVDATPDPLQHVFFADSGSVSVEVALKLAFQYHRARGENRPRMAALLGGYHGDTLGCMSVTDPVGGMHALFTGVLPQHLFLPRPPAGLHRPAADLDVQLWAQEVEVAFAQHGDDIAAVILEPLLQGAGGMHLYSPDCVRLLAATARRHGCLVIFDEIATGLGRTGTRWAADRCAVVPDIMTIGKALTGGFMTLAAMLTTTDVATTVTRGTGALMHGPTFMANPLACAVAHASVSVLAANGWGHDDVARLERGLTTGLEPARALASVRDVRVVGGVGVIQLREAVDVPRVTRAALAQGVWVRPFRDLVYTMPPYVSTDDEVAQIGSALVNAVSEVHG